MWDECTRWREKHTDYRIHYNDELQLLRRPNQLKSPWDKVFEAGEQKKREMKAEKEKRDEELKRKIRENIEKMKRTRAGMWDGAPEELKDFVAARYDPKIDR